jgi:protein-arginine kinase
VGLNLIHDLSVYTLNKLLIFTQPAHLAQRAERALTDPDLPAIRATYVRTLLDDDAARRPRGGAPGAEA